MSIANRLNKLEAAIRSQRDDGPCPACGIDPEHLAWRVVFDGDEPVAPEDETPCPVCHRKKVYTITFEELDAKPNNGEND